MTITLTSQATDGTPLKAVFDPTKGMNLISYTRGDVEVMDQQTSSLFEERCAGLGALIGPHFHHRNANIIPKVDESLFPHIPSLKKKGQAEPLSHGIARYVAWRAEQPTEQSVRAELSGKGEWKGVALSELQGQDFRYEYSANLGPDGLDIDMNIRSDSDSVIGLHYYYALPKGGGTVTGDITPVYMDQGEEKTVPNSWPRDDQGVLRWDLSDEADYGFQPLKDRCVGNIVLDAGDYRLTTSYRTASAENSWQLYRPAGGSFVCIEPMTARNPRKPMLTVSGIQVRLSIDVE